MSVKPSVPAADASKVTVVDPSRWTRADPAADPASPTASPTPPAPGRVVLEHLVVLTAVAWALFGLAHAEGGRGSGALAWATLAVIAALVVTKPWRRLTSRWWLLAPATAVAALVVLVVTGSGRGGAVAASSYALGAALLVVVAAYGLRRRRRAAVATVLAAAGVAQFAWALVPWWGGGNPASPMVGTYYWYNQFAAALVAPALVGLALAAGGMRPWRFAGWVAAPLSVAGVVFSTSRATLGLLVVGWLAVGVVAVFSAADRRRAVIRVVAVSFLAVLVTVVLPGPPLFSTRSSPVAGSAARAGSGETLTSSGSYRTQFWREALVAGARNPWAGAGYGRIAGASSGHVPAGWAVSPLAHSGPLQALGDGGLLLGVPFVLGLGAAVVGLSRRTRWKGRSPADTLVVRASAITALLLVAHSLVDTDWTYPALLAQLAIVTGLALSVARPPAVAADEPSARAAHHVRVAATVVLGAALITGAAVSWGQPFHILDRSTAIGGVQQ